MVNVSQIREPTPEVPITISTLPGDNVSSVMSNGLGPFPNARGFKMAFLNIVSLSKKN